MVVLLASCWGEPTYPHELVEADSAMYRGDYRQADSLLRQFEQDNAHPCGADQQYVRLLRVGLQYKRGQQQGNLFAADSLMHYYDGHSPRKHALSLFYMALAYRDLGNHTESANYMLQALYKTKAIGDINLLSWIYRAQGDAYTQQQMYDDAVKAYRAFYYYAMASSSHLQRTLATFYMGSVCTMEDKADSTIFYYQQTIKMARTLDQEACEDITLKSRCALGDIYTQLEEYDKAASVMGADSLFDAMWGYWHLAQNHLDEAAVYFKKVLNRYDIYGKTEILRQLSEIERSRGNTKSSTHYYVEYTKALDSIKLVSRAKELQQLKAGYEYKLMEEERNEMAQSLRNGRVIVVLLLAVIMIILLLGYYYWKSLREKHECIATKNQLLQQVAEEQRRVSLQQMTENNRRISELEQQLQQMGNRQDSRTMQQIEILTMANQNIEAVQKQRQAMLDEMHQSALYQRVINHAGDSDFHLRPAEWEELIGLVDRAYGNFFVRLRKLVHLNQTETEVCCLRKIGIDPAKIAILILRSKSTVTATRQRLYKKIMGVDGSPAQMDEFLRDF